MNSSSLFFPNYVITQCTKYMTKMNDQTKPKHFQKTNE